MAIIYLVLAWYLAQIFSAGGGSSKRFYFPLQKGYWFELAAPPAEGETLLKEQQSTDRTSSFYSPQNRDR